MNLLVKKLSVAAVLLLPLFFVSCEDPGKIGLNVDPKNGVILTKYQEFVLPSAEVQFNPRTTINSSSLQAGSYTDPDFGIVSSKSFVWLGVQSTTPSLSGTAAYDSLELSVRFLGVYGSEVMNEEIETIDLYQLAEGMEPGYEYTRVDERPLGNKIGTLDFYLQREDTLQNDSTFTFKLSDSFGQELFDKLKANDGTYEDDTTFNAAIKGLALTSSGANDKIVFLTPSTFSVKMYYHELNVDNEPVQRTYSFTLGDFRFYNIDSDLNGTPLAGIQDNNQDFNPSSDYRYMQGGTMIALKVDYSDFFEFAAADSNKNMVIQKAKLKIGSIEENISGSDAPSSLKGFFTDDANQWPITTEYTTSVDTADVFVQLQGDLTPPGIYINSQNILFGVVDTTAYEAEMTTLMQNLYAGEYDSEETPYERKGKLFLFPPSDPSYPQSSISYTSTTHFKVHKDSIKLEIYYTVPN
ncbi:MAG: DUF4270 family protein [Cyclobacteriaceae bacterium]|nr:DUF4270 family protein [Cyclobacteriaceae bacterium]